MFSCKFVKFLITSCQQNTSDRRHPHHRRHFFFFTHAKISQTNFTHPTHGIFSDQRQNIWAHANYVTQAKIWLTPPTNPRTNATHDTYAI